MQIKNRIVSTIIAFIVVLVASTLFACQKPPTVYSVCYISESGGVVYGDIHQEVEEGNDGTQVIAVANEGYEFSGWSDGVETPERAETAVCADIKVMAKFIKLNYYSVRYLSESGGVVYGDIHQEIEEGKDGTQVIAVANEGYEFSGWSDGMETPERAETAVCADITVTAKYKMITEHTLSYTGDDGCDIVGDAIQYVRDGKNGAAVSVSVKSGHRFVKWSDGVLTRTRKDLEVEDNIDVSAMTEKIVVEFYSDDYLVRRLNLTEINTTDLSKLVGYRSKSEFVGWKYKDEKIVGGSFTDALFSLKQQFNMFGISNVDNIELEAVYEEINRGSVPENYITIAHALGGYNGKTYTNSLEAFDYYYELGQRFFEADITVTTDGFFVAAHDWSQFSLDEKRTEMAEEGLTLLDLSDLINVLYEHEDVWLDLDILGVGKGYNIADSDPLYIEFYKTLDEIVQAKDVSIYDRIILEILPTDKTMMFENAKTYSGLKNFLYAEYYDSSYPLTDDESFLTVGRYCKDNGVEYLSISSVTKNQVDILHSFGVYVMVFSYDAPERMYSFYDIGVDCIFTDFCFM